ncbi:MAG: TauD/TfdA family dioxygenase [Burkholderiales bacterium]
MTPTGAALGAHITDIDLGAPIDTPTFAALRAAWLAHSVLVFPGQRLETAAQVRFAEHFGELAVTLGGYASNEPQFPGVMYVTNEKRDGKYVGALPDGEMYFHSDMRYLERPIMATMLSAMEVPHVGGNTLFASGYAAYDALDAATQACLVGLRASNIFDPNPQNQDYAKPATRVQFGPNAKSFVHPVVRTHPETGRKALFVNRLMTHRIEGMAESESAATLEGLFSLQEGRRFIYEHSWSPGDLVIWDNRCTLHARSDFDSREARKLRRVAVRGDRPN